MKTDEQTTIESFEEQHSKSEELLKVTPIDDTPFAVVHDKEKNLYFGCMGNYRLTEGMQFENEAIKECTKLTWNNIVRTFMCILHNQNEVYNTIKDEIK